MIYRYILLALAVCLPLVVVGQTEEDVFDYICVCNRNNRSTSIINTATDEVVRTIYHTTDFSDLYVNASIPMYCNYYENDNGKFMTVGDRGNWNVWFFDTENDFELVQNLQVGPGLFHHWVSTTANQIWVVCDGGSISNPLRDSDVAVWVFDLTTYELLAQIPFPEKLKEVALESRATFHDVVVAPNGEFAVVSSYRFPSINDFVFKFATTGNVGEELGRAPSGTLTHVTFEEQDRPIYAISQTSLLDSITLINSESMEVEKIVPGLAGAHMMVGPGADGKSYYVTNLPGGGIDGLFVFDAELRDVDYSTTTNTQYDVPHNVALSKDKSKLYLTHSGPGNNVVSVWDVSNPFNPRPRFDRTIDTGSNPYGIFNFQSFIKFGDAQSGQGGSAGHLAVPFAVLACAVLHFLNQ